MPSGPRKRRAAKRKKEMEEQMKAPPSPSDSSQDAGQSEDRVPHEGGEEDSRSPTFSSAPIFSGAENQKSLASKEWFGSEAAGSAAESSKNLKDQDVVEEDERELVPAVKEVAFRPEVESVAKSEEVAESVKENSKPAEESTISVDDAIVLTEKSQVTEFAARVLEETSGDNTEKETQLPGVDEIAHHDGDGHQVAGGDETSPATEVLEERNQVTEFPARVLEETSGDNTEKETQLPGVDGVAHHDGNGHQVAGGDETSSATEVLEEGISRADGEKESQLPDVDVAVKHEGDGRRAAVGEESLPATEAGPASLSAGGAPHEMVELLWIA